MLIGSANEVANTVIISGTKIKKPTNEQTPSKTRETKFEHSSHSSFNLDIVLLETEQKKTKQSIFGMENLQRVRC